MQIGDKVSWDMVTVDPAWAQAGSVVFNTEIVTGTVIDVFDDCSVKVAPNGGGEPVSLFDSQVRPAS